MRWQYMLLLLATVAAHALAGPKMETDGNQRSAPIFVRGANATACYRIPLAVRVPCTQSAHSKCTAGYVLLAFAEARILNCLSLIHI